MNISGGTFSVPLRRQRIRHSAPTGSPVAISPMIWYTADSSFAYSAPRKSLSANSRLATSACMAGVYVSYIALPARLA